MRRGLNISINSDDPPFLYGANLIDNYLAIADAFGLTPHDLRRTAATRPMVNDRWTPAEVQAFLGHRDPRIPLPCTRW